MWYREADVPDWLSEARSIIRLDGGEETEVVGEEEDLIMERIMSRYDDDDVDNIAYDDEDDFDEDDEGLDEDDDLDEEFDPDWDDEDDEDDEFDDDDFDDLDEEDDEDDD